VNDLLFSGDDLVFSDETAYAMISAYQWPRNPGNVIVFPIFHYENIYALPVEVGSRIHWLGREVALAMKSAWECDGVSTRQHNEPAGNQDVWHYHMHVTPRFQGDDLYKTYVEEKALMPPAERAKLARDLTKHLKI
jgi:histidine triad (HIT) family protein